MDFRDSTEEAAFRERLRGWLTEQKGKFPTSGDEYWATQGAWHQALYEAGFVSAAHTDADIASTVAAAREVFKTL